MASASADATVRLWNPDTAKTVGQPLPGHTSAVSSVVFSPDGHRLATATTQLGGTTLIMPTFEVQTFLRATVDEQINIVTSAPAIFWLAMDQPPTRGVGPQQRPLGLLRRRADRT